MGRLARAKTTVHMRSIGEKGRSNSESLLNFCFLFPTSSYRYIKEVKFPRQNRWYATLQSVAFWREERWMRSNFMPDCLSLQCPCIPSRYTTVLPCLTFTNVSYVSKCHTQRYTILLHK